MESPFYEMTHDFEEDNRIANEAYNRGYNRGQADGRVELLKYIVSLSDEDLKTYLDSFKKLFGGAAK